MYAASQHPILLESTSQQVSLVCQGNIQRISGSKGNTNSCRTYQESHYGVSVLEKLYKQQDQLCFCDVIFSIQEEKFEAHRCVVATCSTYLASIFRKKQALREAINFNDCLLNIQAFKAFLAFAYSGSITITQESVVELVRVADRMQAETLKQLCEQFLLEFLQPGNCLSNRELARRYKLTKLHAAACSLLDHHYTAVLTGTEVLTLPKPALEALVQMQQAHSSNSNAVLVCVLRWLLHSIMSEDASSDSHASSVAVRNTPTLLTLVPWVDVTPCLVADILLALSSQLGPTHGLVNHLAEACLQHELLPPSLHYLVERHQAVVDEIIDLASFNEMAIKTAIQTMNVSCSASISELKHIKYEINRVHKFLNTNNCITSKDVTNLINSDGKTSINNSSSTYQMKKKHSLQNREVDTLLIILEYFKKYSHRRDDKPSEYCEHLSERSHCAISPSTTISPSTSISPSTTISLSTAQAKSDQTSANVRLFQPSHTDDFSKCSLGCNDVSDMTYTVMERQPPACHTSMMLTSDDIYESSIRSLPSLCSMYSCFPQHNGENSNNRKEVFSNGRGEVSKEVHMCLHSPDSSEYFLLHNSLEAGPSNNDTHSISNLGNQEDSKASCRQMSSHASRSSTVHLDLHYEDHSTVDGGCVELVGVHNQTIPSRYCETVRDDFDQTPLKLTLEDNKLSLSTRRKSVDVDELGSVYRRFQADEYSESDAHLMSRLSQKHNESHAVLSANDTNVPSSNGNFLFAPNTSDNSLDSGDCNSKSISPIINTSNSSINSSTLKTLEEKSHVHDDSHNEIMSSNCMEDNSCDTRASYNMPQDMTVRRVSQEDCVPPSSASETWQCCEDSLAPRCRTVQTEPKVNAEENVGQYRAVGKTLAGSLLDGSRRYDMPAKVLNELLQQSQNFEAHATLVNNFDDPLIQNCVADYNSEYVTKKSKFNKTLNYLQREELMDKQVFDSGIRSIGSRSANNEIMIPAKKRSFESFDVVDSNISLHSQLSPKSLKDTTSSNTGWPSKLQANEREWLQAEQIYTSSQACVSTNNLSSNCCTASATEHSSKRNPSPSLTVTAHFCDDKVVKSSECTKQNYCSDKIMDTIKCSKEVFCKDELVASSDCTEKVQCKHFTEVRPCTKEVHNKDGGYGVTAISCHNEVGDNKVISSNSSAVLLAQTKVNAINSSPDYSLNSLQKVKLKIFKAMKNFSVPMREDSTVEAGRDSNVQSVSGARVIDSRDTTEVVQADQHTAVTGINTNGGNTHRNIHSNVKDVISNDRQCNRFSSILNVTSNGSPKNTSIKFKYRYPVTRGVRAEVPADTSRPEPAILGFQSVLTESSREAPQTERVSTLQEIDQTAHNCNTPSLSAEEVTHSSFTHLLPQVSGITLNEIILPSEESQGLQAGRLRNDVENTDNRHQDTTKQTSSPEGAHERSSPTRALQEEQRQPDADCVTKERFSSEIIESDTIHSKACPDQLETSMEICSKPSTSESLNSVNNTLKDEVKTLEVKVVVDECHQLSVSADGSKRSLDKVSKVSKKKRSLSEASGYDEGRETASNKKVRRCSSSVKRGDDRGRAGRSPVSVEYKPEPQKVHKKGRGKAACTAAGDCTAPSACEKLAPPKSSRRQVSRSCDVCKGEFVGKLYFKHMVEHFPGPKHECDTCGQAFSRIYHLLEHRRTHSLTRPFSCTECSFSCHKQDNLRVHLLSHHQHERPHVCPVCGSSFARRQLLQEHSARHSSARPYACNTCSFTSKTSNALALHRRTHTGTTYSCNFEDCAYSTAKKSHFAAHLLTHSSERQFTCDTCDKSFRVKALLLRHQRTHVLEKPYHCSLCQYTVIRKDALKRHIEKMHKSKDIGTNSPFKRKKQLKKRMGSQVLDTHSPPPAVVVSKEQNQDVTVTASSAVAESRQGASEAPYSTAAQRLTARLPSIATLGHSKPMFGTTFIQTIENGTKIECTQAELFSEMEGSTTSVLLQPQLPGGPPLSTTFSGYSSAELSSSHQHRYSAHYIPSNHHHCHHNAMSKDSLQVPASVLVEGAIEDQSCTVPSESCIDAATAATLPTCCTELIGYPCREDATLSDCGGYTSSSAHASSVLHPCATEDASAETQQCSNAAWLRYTSDGGGSSDEANRSAAAPFSQDTCDTDSLAGAYTGASSRRYFALEMENACSRSRMEGSNEPVIEGEKQSRHYFIIENSNHSNEPRMFNIDTRHTEHCAALDASNSLPLNHFSDIGNPSHRFSTVGDKNSEQYVTLAGEHSALIPENGIHSNLYSSSECSSTQNHAIEGELRETPASTSTNTTLYQTNSQPLPPDCSSTDAALYMSSNQSYLVESAVPTIAVESIPENVHWYIKNTP